MKFIKVMGTVVLSLGILMGCSPEKNKEVESKVIISGEITEYEKKLKANEEELNNVKQMLELTKEAVNEREESIERLSNRIKELEDMIDFPEIDPNKKNFTGIGDSEFVTQPRQDKESKGDSDFD